MTGIQTRTGTRKVYRQGQEQDRYTDMGRNKTGIKTGTGTRPEYRKGQEQENSKKNKTFRD